MKILAVDDNKLIRTILSRLLEDFGCVDTARSGEEGIDLFRKSLQPGAERYSLICMDMSMGAGMTGDQALTEIRRIEKELNIPPTKVLMVTAFADKESVMRTKDLCDGYILKPIVRETFFEKLKSFGFEAKPAPQTTKGTGEEVEKSLKGSEDAQELKGKIDLAAWDSTPILALREERIVALVPRKLENPEAPPTLTMTPPDRVEAFKSVKPYSLVARVETDSIPLICGEDMAYLPELKAFVARRGGRAVVAGGVFDINPLMEIEGDLRYQDIDFAGRLHIKGDVADMLTISADEGITIDGDVGCSSLRSKGEIKFRRLNGHGRSTVAAEDDVSAEYIYNADIRASGNIEITHECVNSDLRSLEEVRAGVIMGGRCTAFKGVQVERAGSPKEVLTTLRAGFNFQDEKAVEEALAKLAAIDAEIASIAQMLGPYASDFRKVFGLQERQQEKIFELAGKRLLLKYGERPEAEADVEAARSRVERFPSAKITISNLLHKGVTLEIGEKNERFPRECLGPINIAANTDDSRYYFMELEQERPS